jgi:host factor-I protein
LLRFRQARPPCLFVRLRYVPLPCPLGLPIIQQQKHKEKETMATEKNQNIQDVFLNTLRKEKVPVTVFLTSGVKLQGNISGFDNFCVVLRRSPQVQLVYKHAIATIVPGQPISLYKGEDAEDAAAADAHAPAHA